MTSPSRTQLAEELLRRLAAAVRSGQLYSRGHPIIGRNLEALSAAVQQLHRSAPSIGHRASSATRSSSTTSRCRKAKTSAGWSGGSRPSASSGSRSTAASRADELAAFVDARHDPRGHDRQRAGAVPDPAPHPGRSGRPRATMSKPARPTWPRFEELYTDAVNRGRDDLGQRRDRVAARRHGGQEDDRRPRAGRLAEPVGAARADHAQGLRQLHVHAHGERLDSDDGAGAGGRHRRARCCASSASGR